jgi:hypothetical protein
MTRQKEVSIAEITAEDTGRQVQVCAAIKDWKLLTPTQKGRPSVGLLWVHPLVGSLPLAKMP